MTSDEAKQLWEDVQANGRRLEGCSAPHTFEDVTPSASALRKRWRCTKCLGEIDGIWRRWYVMGLAHGAGVTKP